MIIGYILCFLAGALSIISVEFESKSLAIISVCLGEAGIYLILTN